MARASRVTLELEFARLPFFHGIFDIADRNQAGGLKTNQEYFSRFVDGQKRDFDYLIYDPQTSGGLLVVVSRHFADAAEALLQADGARAWRVGTVIPAIPDIHIHMV
jgi:selenophosphate synthase